LLDEDKAEALYHLNKEFLYWSRCNMLASLMEEDLDLWTSH